MAMFNNQQPNSGDGKESVNTRGFQLYNSFGEFKSTMSVGYWNDVFLTISIAPLRPKELQTEKEKFDYENDIRAAINTQKLIELLNNYDRIVEAYRKGESANAYVDVSGNNLVGFGTMKGAEGQIFYMAIHRGLNDNRIPSQSGYYQFNHGQSINNYDPKAGTYEIGSDELGEFGLIKKAFEYCIENTMHATAHSIRVVSDWSRQRTENKLDAIASKLGINVEQFSGRKNRLFGSMHPGDKVTIQNVTNAAAAAFAGEDAPKPESGSEPARTTTTELPGADAELPF